ncbi:MAG: hypothetical protein FJ030_07370 [Chloroflexi bacterium]|nr:hypothetical protein [Chloroflexota bacterium]
MQFNVGDRVMHASQGSGQIIAIEEKRLSGDEARLYYVVATSHSKVWVPVESGRASSLRLLASNSDLAHCRVLLKSRPASLSADRRQRYLDLNHRLRLSSFEIRCEVIRDLTAHGWVKPLSEADATALRKIREDVCQEWATAAGVPVSEAAREITVLLQEGRQRHGD